MSLRGHVAARKELLSAEQKLLRLDFANRHSKKTNEWQAVLFNDESSEGCW